MPGLSGFDVLQALQSKFQLGELPVIMVSADSLAHTLLLILCVVLARRVGMSFKNPARNDLILLGYLVDTGTCGRGGLQVVAWPVQQDGTRSHCRSAHAALFSNVASVKNMLRCENCEKCESCES